MNKQTLLALMVWAIDMDALSWSFEKAWKHFKKNAESMLLTYTDPEDPTLFISKAVNSDPIKFFTDWIMFYAWLGVKEGHRDYGKYNNKILNYKKS